MDLHVLPKIWDDFLVSKGFASSFIGLWRDRAPSPTADHWAFNLDDERAGEQLTAAIEAVVPEMIHLLDPANFLDYVRLPVRQSEKVNPRREAVLAVLLAAQGPSEELEQQLEKLGGDPRWETFDGETTSFIRDRLVERG